MSRLDKSNPDEIDGARPRLVLENFTPYRLNTLARFASEGFVNSYAREAREFGIGPAEWRVISFLGEQCGSRKGTEEMTARDIGARTFMQKVQVSRAILKLERKRLISRRLNFNDRREVFLKLTPSGKRVYAVIAPIAFFFLLHDYQRNRVLIFLDPESDPLGAGYHISQSKIAIGSGGIFGKGFLNGSQSHLDYLPEGHTDFVFATMAEEWGLLGGLLLIAAFIFLVRWGVTLSQRVEGKFARLVSAGLATTIFFYVAINLMMVMGLAPVVGIPLPLFSFGGSAMMTVMICVGILMGIERGNRTRSRFG